jgi:hypothetical protein
MQQTATVFECLFVPPLSKLAYSDGEVVGAATGAFDASATAAALALSAAAPDIVVSRKGHSDISSCKHLLRNTQGSHVRCVEHQAGINSIGNKILIGDVQGDLPV